VHPAELASASTRTLGVVRDTGGRNLWRRSIGRPRHVRQRLFRPIALGGRVIFAAALLGTAVVSASSGARASSAVRTVNLLLNPGAEAGAASAHGWDAVTIPGWQIVSGLPTVVRYGTRGFPPSSENSPGAGDHLFAGGAGGTARLVQVVPIRTETRGSGASAISYELCARLGGTATSAASVKVAFVSKSGHVLARARIGPVGGATHGGVEFAERSKTGVLPAGTVAAHVELVLASALADDDGPHAPIVGYDYAVADDLDLSLSVPVARPAPLVPPPAHVPRFAHVFLVYFENQDFAQIVGNTAQAPYLNHLISSGSLLADFFAEEHPSDGNYLAFAGGSTFGIPLTDPLEENPRYTIDARNIGDLVDAAHETWAGFLQSADGPCDDTVHGYYWNDDIPMLYFKDVRERPSYCAAHLLPLQALRPDLRRAASTPSFSWIGPNDCSDMEACGIKAGDEFLEQIASEIFRSPAWTTQRSLLIVTFDEDSYDEQRPAQLVPTLVLGSQDVRRGYVSSARYTHYSLLRTVEAALGLGTLTRNDLYAAPMNDVFTTS
jgi:phosphoesterase family protein